MDDGTFAYKLAIAIPGTLSFLLTIFTLSLVFLYTKLGTRFCRKIFRTENSNHSFEVDWKIVALLSADVLQSCASQVSYYWVFFDITDPANQFLCAYQGIAIAIADLASAFCSTYICYAVMESVFWNKGTKKQSWVEPLVLCLCFAVPIAFTFSVFLIEPSIPGAPAFEDNGNHGWCFMSPSQAGPRVWNHYFWIVLCIIFNFAGYIYIITKITEMKRCQLVSSADRLTRLTRVIKKLVMYPICFFIIFSPIAVDRCLRYFKILLPSTVTVAFVSLLMCNGIVNSILCLIKIRSKIRGCSIERIESSTLYSAPWAVDKEMESKIYSREVSITPVNQNVTFYSSC